MLWMIPIASPCNQESGECVSSVITIIYLLTVQKKRKRLGLSLPQDLIFVINKVTESVEVQVL